MSTVPPDARPEAPRYVVTIHSRSSVAGGLSVVADLVGADRGYAGPVFLPGVAANASDDTVRAAVLALFGLADRATARVV